MDIQEQAKIMRREGKILLRQDFPSNIGFKSIFWVKYQGTEYIHDTNVKRTSPTYRISSRVKD